MYAAQSSPFSCKYTRFPTLFLRMKKILLRLTSLHATDVFYCDSVADAMCRAMQFKKNDEYAHISLDCGKTWRKI